MGARARTHTHTHIHTRGGQPGTAIAHTTNTRTHTGPRRGCMWRVHNTHRAHAGLARPTSHRASYLYPETLRRSQDTHTHTHRPRNSYPHTACWLVHPSPPISKTDTQTVRISPTDPLLICPQSHRDSQGGRHEHRQTHQLGHCHFSGTRAPPRKAPATDKTYTPQDSYTYQHKTDLHGHTGTLYNCNTPTCDQLSDPGTHVKQAHMSSDPDESPHASNNTDSRHPPTLLPQPPNTITNCQPWTRAHTHTTANPTLAWQGAHLKHPQKTLVSRD